MSASTCSRTHDTAAADRLVEAVVIDDIPHSLVIFPPDVDTEGVRNGVVGPRHEPVSLPAQKSKSTSLAIGPSRDFDPFVDPLHRLRAQMPPRDR
jgi:hypothetical protein